VLGCDALAAGLEKVEDLAATRYGLALEELFDEPEEEGGFAAFFVGEDG